MNVWPWNEINRLRRERAALDFGFDRMFQQACDAQNKSMEYLDQLNTARAEIRRLNEIEARRVGGAKLERVQ